MPTLASISSHRSETCPACGKPCDEKRSSNTLHPHILLELQDVVERLTTGCQNESLASILRSRVRQGRPFRPEPPAPSSVTSVTQRARHQRKVRDTFRKLFSTMFGSKVGKLFENWPRRSLSTSISLSPLRDDGSPASLVPQGVGQRAQPETEMGRS